MAHALGIHESEPEFDYFTAVDDEVEGREESGAGMIGTVQMMSSTLYRFASVNVDSLAENLASQGTAVQATAAFVNSFVNALPTGKQNTFAHNTLPELVYITVSDQRSVSLVNAFENPVKATKTLGRRQVGAQALANEISEIKRAYGFEPQASFVIALGDLNEPFEGLAESVSLHELEDKIIQTVQSLLSES